MLVEYMVHRHRAGLEWTEVVHKLVDHFKSQWPFPTLGDPEEAPKTFTVSVSALGHKVRDWNAKYSRLPGPLRSKALQILAAAGHMYFPRSTCA